VSVNKEIQTMDTQAAWAASRLAIQARDAYWRELERVYGKRANHEHWHGDHTKWPQPLLNLRIMLREANALMNEAWQRSREPLDLT
jgi:hypothetical protein